MIAIRSLTMQNFCPSVCFVLQTGVRGRHAVRRAGGSGKRGQETGPEPAWDSRLVGPRALAARLEDAKIKQVMKN